MAFARAFRGLLPCSMLCAGLGCSTLVDAPPATYRAGNAQLAPGEERLSLPHEPRPNLFGSAFALDGERLVVAAATAPLRAYSGDELTCGKTLDATKAGMAYVFERSSGTWSLRAVLDRDEAAPDEGYPAYPSTSMRIPLVSVASAGNTIVYGLPGFSLNACTSRRFGIDDSDKQGLSKTGAVFVFDRNEAGEWIRTEVLHSNPVHSDDYFGNRVVLRDRWLFVGVTGDDTGLELDDPPIENSGAVYVYERRAGHFEFVKRLKAENAVPNANFGSGIELSGDTMVIGAWADSHGEKGINPEPTNSSLAFSGAAYVFRERKDGWKQEAFIKAFNSQIGSVFATNMAIEGDLMVLGAPYESSDGQSARADALDETTLSYPLDTQQAGAAYLYRREGTAWRLDSYLKPPQAELEGNFGVAVVLHGSQLFVSAPGEHGAAGSVYVYDLPDIWHPRVIRRRDEESEDVFGYAIAVDDEQVIISSPRSDRANDRPGVISIFPQPESAH